MPEEGTKTEAEETPQVVEESQVEVPVVSEQPEAGTAEPGEQPVQPEEVPESKKIRLKWNGQDIEVDESEIPELAQKGFDYTKKMQSLSELEKANQQKLQLAEQLMSNPNAVKYVVAQQLGYDPDMVSGRVQPPPESWKEMYPEEFGRQQTYYEVAQRQKEQFDNALQGMITMNAQSANNAAFQRARLENNLSDEQFGKVQDFVQTRMRPNQSGFYSPEDVNYAVMALYGNERIASEKLKQADQIQKNIKTATSPKTVPKRSVEEVPSELKDARDFKKFVQESQGGWAKRS